MGPAGTEREREREESAQWEMNECRAALTGRSNILLAVASNHPLARVSKQNTILRIDRILLFDLISCC